MAATGRVLPAGERFLVAVSAALANAPNRSLITTLPEGVVSNPSLHRLSPKITTLSRVYLIAEHFRP